MPTPCNRGDGGRRLDRVTYKERVVNMLMRGVFRLICRMNVSELDRLPPRGPAMLITNHTTNIEGPAYYVFIQPRPATALGKRELWKHWYTRFFMELWNIIPVARGQVDRRALTAAMRALDRNMILGIAPEGTRSPDGTLQAGHPGVALLASRRSVPVYPVVHWGFRDLGRNFRKLRRTSVTFRVGRPFRVPSRSSARLSPTELRDITDEMMAEMARLLPPRMRGIYANRTAAEPRHLEYIDTAQEETHE
jgi:1-acyl-sn-glycerol-3-phosphate acyltransferase